MVLEPHIEEESQTIAVGVQETIASIKEIVKDHSDADIFAALKESDMDPNETTQKLLHQDPFHEVRRRKDKKKEEAPFTKFLPTGRRSFVDTSKHVEHIAIRQKFHLSWDRSARRGGYGLNSRPGTRGVSREFRVVRDNRVNQNTNQNDKQDTPHQSISGNEQTLLRVPDSSSARQSDQKHSDGANSDSYFLPAGLNISSNGSVHARDERSNGTRRSHNDEQQDTVSTSQDQSPPINSALHSKLLSNNSVSGVYSSSSDPVHVPSPDSRPAGIVGAIRREVGVVGSRRQSSAANLSTPNNSILTPSLGKYITSQTVLPSNQVVTTKSNQPNHVVGPVSILPNSTMNRPFHGAYNKLHHPSFSHHKVVHSNMEWKPKSSQKANISSSGVGGSDPIIPSAAATSSNSNVTDVAGLSEKLSQISVLENQHVIIPEHLLVPESERTRLTFGSFVSTFESDRELPISNTQRFGDEPSVRTSSSDPAGSNLDAFLGDHDDKAQAIISQSDPSTSTAETGGQQAGKMDAAGPEDIGNYADIGLLQCTSPVYSSTDEQQLQNNPSLSSFSAYENQESYDAPFFRVVGEDNMHNQGLASSSEALGSVAAGAGPLSEMAMAQQQQFVQPQQSVAQMYPQVHIPHYMPYRHIFSPVYVPPMAMPNYSSNPAYPHPSNGNSYVLMPGGGSHLNAGGMKYAPSQYKPVAAANPTAYGSYPNPPSYAINSSGTVGNVISLEDLSRLKYRDNSLYVPNPQAETGDIWIQTPRDLQSLQSPSYYNLSGQAPHAAFMPTHAGHAFNASAQTPHVQYPGLYHPQQPGSVPNPHHLVHQPVQQGLGGSVGVGVAAPGPQVGAYQQPQLGHLNWTANF